MTTPEDDGRTPGTPSVDEPDDGEHRSADDTAGRTPSSPGVDEQDGAPESGR